MHFEFNVTIGQIMVMASFVGMVWRVEKLLAWFLVEHEMLISDYCDRKGFKVGQLPTRVKR